MPEIINRISSEAVRKATGKTWDEWLATLDQKVAGEMPHKGIARLFIQELQTTICLKAYL
jgi:hypothetical protein